MMFNNLTKLMKILMRENSLQQVLFHFSRFTGILKILLSIKNLGQYEKFPRDKFVKKKEYFAKYFAVCNFFSITMLSC